MQCLQNAEMPGFGAASTGSLIDLHHDQSSGPAVLNVSEPGPFISPMYSGRERAGRSRQSSLSSQASGDAHMYSPVAAATARAVRQYAIPSDAESSVGGDVDDLADSLQHMTRDELIQRYSHVQQRADKYRTRYGQVTSSHCFIVLSGKTLVMKCLRPG